MIRLTRAQVREIDRRSIEEYHIPGIVLMENAARGAAEVACEMLDGECVGQVLILCGGGNNGGDGLALARHLDNRGVDVSIALAVDPARYKAEALVNWQIVSAMKIPWRPLTPESLSEVHPLLIIDALFGTGLSEPARDPFPAIAAAVGKTHLPVLAIDLPSGLDCDTGHPLGACIRATRTVTFVAEKVGFASPAARDYLGHVTVVPIECPRDLISRFAPAAHQPESSQTLTPPAPPPIIPGT